MPDISAKKIRNREEALKKYKADKLSISKSKVRVPLRYVEHLVTEEVALMLALKTLSFFGKVNMQLKPVRKQLQDGTLKINDFIDRHNINYTNLYVSLEDIESEYKMLYGFNFDMLWTDKVTPFFDMKLGNIIELLYDKQYPPTVEFGCNVLRTITKYLGPINDYHNISTLEDCDGDYNNYKHSQLFNRIIEKCNKVNLK